MSEQAAASKEAVTQFGKMNQKSDFPQAVDGKMDQNSFSSEG